MLRETSIVYSSLPQEEGSGGGSSGSNNRSNTPAFVTTRSKNPHSRRDCQLTSLIMALVIICGVTLAVLLPLALQNKADPSGLREAEVANITTPNLIGNNGLDIQGNTPDGNSTDIHTGDDAVGGNNKDTSNESGLPLPSQIMTTTSQEIPTVRLTTPKLVSTVVTTTPFPLPVTLPKPIITTTYPLRPTLPVQPFEKVTMKNYESNTKDDKEDSSGKTKEDNSSDNVGILGEKEGDTGTKDQSEDGIITTKKGPSNIFGQSGEVSTEIDDTKDNLLNDIYGKDGFSVKPSSTKSFSGWMNEIMSGHDQSTLVVLVVLVAVAAAMVVAAVAWVVQRRLASRRRRINIQSVITDLQSRDKVVLLNSEDSDEEP